MFVDFLVNMNAFCSSSGETLDPRVASVRLQNSYDMTHGYHRLVPLTVFGLTGQERVIYNVIIVSFCQKHKRAEVL